MKGGLQEEDATHTKAEEPSLPLNIEDLEHWYLGFRFFSLTTLLSNRAGVIPDLSFGGFLEFA